MDDRWELSAGDAAGLAPGWKSVVLVLALYTACTLWATYPVVATLGSALPAPPLDPLQHLWIMRWYKTCLLEGRLPFLCPDLQYPVGAPLGNFSPMHFESLLYLPLSLVIQNDIVCYNLIWLAGFVFTGLGTFLLGWYVLRHRAAACFGGLLAMFSTPLMAHSFGHVELIYLGWFPLFLVAWLRFVDQPGWGRLVAAGLTYVLVAMSAAYFTVFAIFPAALYAVWQAASAARRADRPWLWNRLRWMVGYLAFTSPLVLIVFSNQIWGMLHGFSLSRPRAEFDLYSAPLWGYIVPTAGHRLGQLLLPFNVYEAAGYGLSAGERASYLGVVTIALLYYAAVNRIGFPRARFWWAVFVMLVILSLGAHWWIGPRRINLPALWVWKLFPPFHLIRVPARFNLFACLVAALLAAAGMRHLLGRFQRASVRTLVWAGLMLAAFYDLTVAYGQYQPPAMPECYTAIVKRDPEATFLEVPQLPSGGSQLNAACGYWQALHHGKTSAGYSGHVNAKFDDLMTFSSPFAAVKLADPDYLANPDASPLDLIPRVRFRDYAWLFLTVHRLHYVVLHRAPDFVPELPVHVARLEEQLKGARLMDDGTTAVYDRSLLPAPSELTTVCTQGWQRRFVWKDRYTCAVGKRAEVAVYNPEPDRRITLTWEGGGFHRVRTVRLLADGRELARWNVSPEAFHTYTSPPFRLPGGLGTLTLESDGESQPRGHRDAPAAGDLRPFSLRVARLELKPVEPPEDVPSRLAGQVKDKQ